jgi:hypothetical protein
VFKQVVSTAKAPSSFLTLEKLSMKKTLIALAVLASTSASFAQSTVTISGAVGFGVQNTFGTRGTARTDGNVNFTAVEDLGGGLKATVVGGVDLAHRGQYAAGRNFSMTLAGGFGTFSMGSANSNFASRLGDAGGTISLDQNIDDIYGSDVNVQSISYTAPKFSDVTLAIGWSGAAGSALTQDAAAVAPGKITKASADISAKYDFTGGNVVATYRPDDARTRFGVNYSLAGVNLGAHFITEYTNAAGTKLPAQTEIEAWMPLGALTVGVQTGSRGAYGTTTKQQGNAFGAKYDLSKRTFITASFAKLDKGVSATANQTQQRIKLHHSF